MPGSGNGQKYKCKSTERNVHVQKSQQVVFCDMADPADPAADVEPTLKYQRMGGSVASILASDTASCLAAHAKFLALGTDSGTVHVLDLGGNEIRRFSPHSAAVADICIDSTGEFVGSCSQDGTVVVSSLFGSEASTHWYHRPVRAIALDPDYSARRVLATGGLACQLVINSRGWFGSKDNVVHSGEGPVQAISIAGPMLAWANDLGVKVYDAQHAKRISYIERTPGSPDPALFRCHLRWESPTELVIGWADTIKIGRVREREREHACCGGCATAPAGVAAGGGAGGSGLYMEIVTLIQTDFYICGLAGAVVRTVDGAPQRDLLLLAYVCELSDEEAYGPGGAPPGGAQRPELRLLSRHNEECFSDALSICGFEDLRCPSYSLVVPPPPGTAGGGSASGAADEAAGCGVSSSRARGHSTEDAAGALAAIGRGERTAAGGQGGAVDDDQLLPETTVYIVSPRDIVVGSSRDWDDRVGWLLARGRVEAALQLATRHQRELRELRLVDIAEVRIGGLLRESKPEEAAQLCVAHLGASAELWTRWLLAFCASGALWSLVAHVPLSQPQLAPSAYEAALVAAIASPQATGSGGPGRHLLELLQHWPPHIYRAQHMQRKVLEAAKQLPGGLHGQPRLMESLAILHCHAKQHEQALRLLLQLPAHETDVFGFVELHSIQAFCRDKVLALAAHSWEKTLALLLRYTEVIPPADVVSQLDVPTTPTPSSSGGSGGGGGGGGDSGAVDAGGGACGDDADRRRLFDYLHALFLQDVHLGSAFHGRMLGLYAIHAPSQLLSFLRASPHFPLEMGLETCVAHGLVEGQVYVLGRMGAHRESLALMLESLGDVKGAVDFVRSSADAELWGALLEHAMQRPETARALLAYVSEEPLRSFDTASLVRQLPDGLEVADLPKRLGAVLAQAANELELTASAVAAAHADRGRLLKERHRLLQGGAPRVAATGGGAPTRD